MEMKDTKLKRFVLNRKEDATGVSGTGIVCEGVQFSDGSISARWTDKKLTSVEFHKDIDNFEKIHGHGGKSKVVWLD